MFQKFRVSKNFMPRRGVSRFSSKKNLSHCAEKFRRGTHLCFRSFGYRKILCLRGEYHDFLPKKICPTVPKNFVEEPICVSEIFGYRKILCFRELCHDSLSKIFCLTVPKNFVGESFSASLISGIEKC